jgi:hypothetical protein
MWTVKLIPGSFGLEEGEQKRGKHSTENRQIYVFLAKRTKRFFGGIHQNAGAR